MKRISGKNLFLSPSTFFSTSTSIVRIDGTIQATVWNTWDFASMASGLHCRLAERNQATLRMTHHSEPAIRKKYRIMAVSVHCQSREVPYKKEIIGLFQHHCSDS